VNVVGFMDSLLPRPTPGDSSLEMNSLDTRKYSSQESSSSDPSTRGKAAWSSSSREAARRRRAAEDALPGVADESA